MKAIKICLVFFFLAAQLFLSSCDNRKDYFIEVNKAPILTLVKNGVELTGNTLIGFAQNRGTVLFALFYLR